MNHSEIVSFLWGVADPQLRRISGFAFYNTSRYDFEKLLADAPHVAANHEWIDTDKRDEKDGQVGLVGYEINFNRCFYRYTPPRPLEEIEGDIREIETDIMRMLGEVTGSRIADPAQ